MGKKIGSEHLGDLYQPGKKVWKRREWRGVKDTLHLSADHDPDDAFSYPRSDHQNHANL